MDPQLGLLRLRRATGVYSAGKIINPRTARSQMIGGVVWGWGMAAMEASHYEPDLGRWLSPDLAGVALPVNADIPPAIDIAFIDEFDAQAGPLGAKGIGELSATGVAAAVANAVFDATGKRIRELPITPGQGHGEGAQLPVLRHENAVLRLALPTWPGTSQRSGCGSPLWHRCSRACAAPRSSPSRPRRSDPQVQYVAVGELQEIRPRLGGRRDQRGTPGRHDAPGRT